MAICLHAGCRYFHPTIAEATIETIWVAKQFSSLHRSVNSFPSRETEARTKVCQGIAGDHSMVRPNRKVLEYLLLCHSPWKALEVAT